MNPHSVGIYYFGMAADNGKVKSVSAFFGEVFHPATVTVKLGDLIGFHIHVCNNESVHVCQLAEWFFNFENHTPWIFP